MIITDFEQPKSRKPKYTTAQINIILSEWFGLHASINVSYFNRGFTKVISKMILRKARRGKLFGSKGHK